MSPIKNTPVNFFFSCLRAGPFTMHPVLRLSSHVVCQSLSSLSPTSLQQHPPLLTLRRRLCMSSHLLFPSHTFECHEFAFHSLLVLASLPPTSTLLQSPSLDSALELGKSFLLLLPFCFPSHPLTLLTQQLGTWLKTGCCFCNK